MVLPGIVCFVLKAPQDVYSFDETIVKYKMWHHLDLKKYKCWRPKICDCEPKQHEISCYLAERMAYTVRKLRKIQIEVS